MDSNLHRRLCSSTGGWVWSSRCFSQTLPWQAILWLFTPRALQIGNWNYAHQHLLLPHMIGSHHVQYVQKLDSDYLLLVLHPPLLWEYLQLRADSPLFLRLDFDQVWLAFCAFCALLSILLQVLLSPLPLAVLSRRPPLLVALCIKDDMPSGKWRSGRPLESTRRDISHLLSILAQQRLNRGHVRLCRSLLFLYPYQPGSRRHLFQQIRQTERDLTCQLQHSHLPHSSFATFCSWIYLRCANSCTIRWFIERGPNSPRSRPGRLQSRFLGCCASADQVWIRNSICYPVLPNWRILQLCCRQGGHRSSQMPPFQQARWMKSVCWPRLALKDLMRCVFHCLPRWARCSRRNQ